MPSSLRYSHWGIFYLCFILDKICCLWRNCYYLTSDPILLIRHLFYHAFHTKIKGRGKSLVTLASSFPDCQVDIPNSNFLQELLNPFECRWASCQVQFFLFKDIKCGILYIFHFVLRKQLSFIHFCSVNIKEDTLFDWPSTFF